MAFLFHRWRRGTTVGRTAVDPGGCSELKPLLVLKGELEALDKLEGKIATVERRLRANL